MKKLSKLLLSAALIITVLAGCSKGSDTPKRGNWDGAVYTSEYAKLKFNLPDGWTTSSDEEVAELMDITAEELSEKGNYSKSALKKQSLFDMMSLNATTGSNVIVMYENLKVSASTKIAIEDYIAALKTQLVSTAGYPSSSLKEGEDLTIQGETYKSLNMNLSSYGINQTYYVRKTGNYITCIIVTLGGGDTLDQVMANFS